MATRIVGIRAFRMTVDQDGYRNYYITIRVACNPTDGPANVYRTQGLPQWGDTWAFLGDVDVWAYCKYVCNIAQVNNLPNQYWDLEYLFSTKPDRRCNETQMEDPLLEPPKISGSFVKYTEEVASDRFGPILTSSWESIHGPTVQFDKNRATVSITQNVVPLNLPLIATLVNCVNANVLWGCPPRTVKLSSVTWEQAFFGTCYSYYRRTLEFDVHLEGFDRTYLDAGTRCLKGHWDKGTWVLDKIGGQDPDPNNPLHFDVFTDSQGNQTKVLLNGDGLPANVVLGPPSSSGVTPSPPLAGSKVRSIYPSGTGSVWKSGFPTPIGITNAVNFPTGGGVVTIYDPTAPGRKGYLWQYSSAVFGDNAGSASATDGTLYECNALDMSHSLQPYTIQPGWAVIYGQASSRPMTGSVLPPVGENTGPPGLFGLSYYNDDNGLFPLLGIPLNLDPYSGLT